MDLAKAVFHLHGAAADGSVLFRRKQRRCQILAFLAEQPRCTVAMEACASSHHWGRAIAELGHARIDVLDKPVRRRAEEDAAMKRLMTVPGVGSIAATALTAFAPPPETFAKGRDIRAWVGLPPRQHSTGGRERLGRITRMGQRDIRRLLITGAVCLVRWAARKGAPEGIWLARMLSRKPRMLVAVALANRTARVA